MFSCGIALLLLALAGTARGESLDGRIWVPGEQRFAAPAELAAAVRRAHFVLLGETHSVERHHELQARFVAAAAAGRRPAVVFEMIPRDRQPAIDAWRAAEPPDPAALGPAVGWEERGWPAWSQYQPIVETALRRDLPLRAGAPADTTVRRVGHAGLGALGPESTALPGLDTPLPSRARERLLDTLRAVHCGLPEHAPVDRMIAVQRLRDASMAERMMAGHKGAGAVLIAGHGHVRRDYGVPLYLARGAPGRSVVSIAFFGTVGKQTVAAQRKAAGGTLPFDFVWFTPGGVAAPECASGPNPEPPSNHR